MTVSIAVTNSASIWMPERAEHREEADDHEHVVEERDQRCDAQAEVPEPVRDPDHDADGAEQDQRQGLGDQVRRNHRAHGREGLLLGNRPETRLERSPQLTELAVGRKLGDTGSERRRRRG